MTEEHLRAALYCAAEVIRSRQLVGQPIPEWLRRHHAKLESEFRMAARGHETGCTETEPAHLTHDWISTADVGRRLGLSMRQARRLADKLGAHTVGGRLLFSRAKVIDYARREGSR